MATNREWLNSLSDEEFVNKMHYDSCDECEYEEVEDAEDEPCMRNCKKGHLAWLKQEHEEELKPCPFCGGEARVYPQPNGFWGIGCQTINCRGYMPSCYSIIDKSIAIRLWNRRA